MDVMSAIEQRRAVKHYDPTHQMDDSEVHRLLELAALSPTAFNIQNWRFVLVRDPEVRRQVRKHAWDQAQVTDASLLFILCADLRAWEKDPQRYWRHAPPQVQDILVPAIDNYYRGKPDVSRDEAMRSCGIAAQTLMLAATAMGYGSCPMDGFDFQKVGEVINLPDDHIIAMMVAIGKQSSDPRPRSGPLDIDELVVYDRFK